MRTRYRKEKNSIMSEIDAKVFMEWTLSTAIPKMAELKLIGNTDLKILISGKEYIFEALNQTKDIGNQKFF